jgi:hypothetical protein
MEGETVTQQQDYHNTEFGYQKSHYKGKNYNKNYKKVILKLYSELL